MDGGDSVAGAMADNRQTGKAWATRLWLLAAGLFSGVAAVLIGGESALWLLLAAAMVVVMLALFMGRRRADTTPLVGAGGADPQNGLPALLRDVFEDVPDPLLLLDKGGRVVFSNSAMRGLTGGGSERLHVSAVLRAPALLAAVERTTATGEALSVELSFPVPIERHFTAHLSRTRAEPYLTVVLMHDLTAIRRAEQTRADFVANASHELRTPLAAISGFIDTLRGHARDDAEARTRFLDIMAVEAARMRRLINDLLSLTRVELNEHVPPSTPVDVVALLRDAVNALTPLAQSETVTIQLTVPDDVPHITGERDELAQVFQNLIHNAIKYGRPGGHVWIGVSLPAAAADEQVLAVAIRDDGEGIPRAAVPRLTERFYRVDVKRSREKGGTGLGLAIVKHIVNRHHGRLQIRSEAGAGSTFTVFLPLKAAESATVTELL
jgi:two-component system phosphate regulon sensor histidine kinase PhoR